MISGTKTWPPYSFSCIGIPKMSAVQDWVPSVALVTQTVSGNRVVSDRLMNSGVIIAPITAAPTQGSTSSFLAAL